jgi:hypothetical protein
VGHLYPGQYKTAEQCLNAWCFRLIATLSGIVEADMAVFITLVALTFVDEFVIQLVENKKREKRKNINYI